ETPVVGMKGGGGAPLLQRLRRQVEAARKALKTGLTDETAQQLEHWLRATDLRLDELHKTLRKGGDAHAPTTAQPPEPSRSTSGDGAPRDEAEALQLLINALYPPQGTTMPDIAELIKQAENRLKGIAQKQFEEYEPKILAAIKAGEGVAELTET